MTTYLLLCGTVLLAALLALKCADHAETKRELAVARELELHERQRREYAEQDLQRATCLPPALLPMARTWELHEVLGLDS